MVSSLGRKVKLIHYSPFLHLYTKSVWVLFVFNNFHKVVHRPSYSNAIHSRKIKFLIRIQMKKKIHTKPDMVLTKSIFSSR